MEMAEYFENGLFGMMHYARYLTSYTVYFFSTIYLHLFSGSKTGFTFFEGH